MYLIKLEKGSYLPTHGNYLIVMISRKPFPKEGSSSIKVFLLVIKDLCQGLISPEVVIPIHIPHVGVLSDKCCMIDTIALNGKIGVHFEPIFHEWGAFSCSNKPGLKSGVLIFENIITL